MLYFSWRIPSFFKNLNNNLLYFFRRAAMLFNQNFYPIPHEYVFFIKKQVMKTIVLIRRIKETH